MQKTIKTWNHFRKARKEFRKIYPKIKNKAIQEIFKDRELRYKILDLAEYIDSQNNNCELTRIILDEILISENSIDDFIFNNSYEKELLCYFY